jgi:hypothetical protein
MYNTEDKEDSRLAIRWQQLWNCALLYLVVAMLLTFRRFDNEIQLRRDMPTPGNPVKFIRNERNTLSSLYLAEIYMPDSKPVLKE